MVSTEEIKRIVSAASWAPSGDNCQPWYLRWDGRRLMVFHDAARARHALNPNNDASIIALGCLLEAISIAASNESYRANVQLSVSDREKSSPWAEVTFEKTDSDTDLLHLWMEKRCTDRRPYKGGNKEVVSALLQQEAEPFSNVHLHFETPNTELMDYLGQTECIIWTNRAAHQDLMLWLRFSDAEARDSKDGLPWRGLGVSYIESRVLKFAKQYPRQELLNKAGFLAGMRKQTRKLIASSAGLMCLTMDKANATNMVELGRCALRAWLRLNQKGYGVQPIASGTFYSFYHEQGILMDGLLPEYVEVIKQGKQILQRAFQLSDSEVPLWVFRTGVSALLPAKARTFRRELSDFFVIDALAFDAASREQRVA